MKLQPISTRDSVAQQLLTLATLYAARDVNHLDCAWALKNITHRVEALLQRENAEMSDER